MEGRKREAYFTRRERAYNNTRMHRLWFSGCFRSIEDTPGFWKDGFQAQKEYYEETGIFIPVGETSMSVWTDFRSRAITHLHREETAQPELD